MARMQDKVALVVGGAKGIGSAIAERLAIEGASVVLTGRRADEVEAAAARIGLGARGLVAEAALQEDLRRVVATLRETHGRIDALVLNAGISEPATLRDGTPEHFDRHFAVNVRGAVFGLQAALSTMGRGGRAGRLDRRHHGGDALGNLRRNESGPAFLRARGQRNWPHRASA